ncbi:alpha/beta fold hydrolase [Actinomadura sp. WMMB 499]|uniref:alpha/beta fold hydrolase n=1 Tax=Actinomadura sp. WMMB 499 TaxID=1219491 RepID=UPI0012446B5D|nr:alpha/beta hydrolase [Actinomadura sp. WMMB 499]QFG24802.1 alpha/beta hydrolase [Actinomadura sp. WMMB 499]
MEEIVHRVVRVNGIRLHYAEAGTGPLVLLIHGFPECWYSWRHQLTALAAAGYRAVAFDQRGYARSDRPRRVEDYTIMNLVGDVIGLLNALGEERAVIAGHDWGGGVAWQTAQLRPDRIRGVIGLSIPHLPRAAMPPTPLMRVGLGEGYYMLHFQKPGVADAELSRDLYDTFRRMLYAPSGDGPQGASLNVPEGSGFLDICPLPDKLPGWLTEEDIDVYVTEYAEAGFTGGLNWYRNLDRNWELTAPWHDAPVLPPALYIVGDRDMTLGMLPDEMISTESVPNLRGTVLLPGCGHWTQQERPEEVNAAMLDFLRSLD